MGLITKVASAKKGTKSLKTTVPEGIAEFLELSDKDELEWKMHTESSKRLALVQKKIGGIELSSKHVRTGSLRASK